MTSTKIKWTRTDYGLTSRCGRFQLHRHEVDDSAQYGVRATYWNLAVDGRTEWQFHLQRDARNYVQRHYGGQANCDDTEVSA